MAELLAHPSPAGEASVMPLGAAKVGMMAKTLENYLRNGIEYGNVIDFAIRAQIEPDGRVTFHIRPEGYDGDTADFEVSGDTLKRNRDVLDWDAAESHFNSTMQIYKDLVGTPGAVAGPALMIVFEPILRLSITHISQ